MCVYTKLLLLLHTHTYIRTHVRTYTYQQMMLDIRSSIGASEVIPADITDLVSYIWNEANGSSTIYCQYQWRALNWSKWRKLKQLYCPLNSFSMGPAKMEMMYVHKLTNEFYAAIPHKQKTALDNKRATAEKQDLCQVRIYTGKYI